MLADGAATGAAGTAGAVPCAVAAEAHAKISSRDQTTRPAVIALSPSSFAPFWSKSIVAGGTQSTQTAIPRFLCDVFHRGFVPRSVAAAAKPKDSRNRQ